MLADTYLHDYLYIKLYYQNKELKKMQFQKQTLEVSLSLLRN